jgi:hypothetical protein
VGICCYITLETVCVIRVSLHSIIVGKKCKIDVFIGNDDGKLVEAWEKLWELVGEDNDDHEKIRKLFVNGGGVKLFLKCMEKFPGNTTLANEMTGCISNVMLDANLRTKMMTQEFAQQIVALADTPDFTDLSSNAIDILCQMLNDGKVSWKKTKLSFTDSLAKVETILDNWNISNVKTTLRALNFDSWFLFLASDFPQLQLNGLWTIACFTRQNDSMCLKIDLTHFFKTVFCTIFN